MTLSYITTVGLSRRCVIGFYLNNLSLRINVKTELDYVKSFLYTRISEMRLNYHIRTSRSTVHRMLFGACYPLGSGEFEPLAGVWSTRW